MAIADATTSGILEGLSFSIADILFLLINPGIKCTILTVSALQCISELLDLDTLMTLNDFKMNLSILREQQSFW